MFEMRVSRLLLVGFTAFGCAPRLHAVNIRTPEGEVRTTVPAPRQPVALAEEQVWRTVAILAREIVPAANPLEAARRRFGVPVRDGMYAFNPRSRQLTPADAAAAETMAPELAEQARGYLRWCEATGRQGDCLQLLGSRPILDAHGRYALAMAIAQGSTLAAMGDSLRGMANPQAVMAAVVAAMTMYLMLWVLPEPVSKGIAATLTVVLAAYLGVDTLYKLGRGWRALVNKADAAASFAQLKEAGEEFAGVMGANTARILVMLTMAAVGSAANLAHAAPSLPGAAPAARLAAAEGLPLAAVGAVQAVTIGEQAMTVALPAGALLMMDARPPAGGGGPPEAGAWGNPRTLEAHFKKHGAELGARSPEDYARMAGDFLRRGRAERLPTKTDPEGVIRVYDPQTRTFGSYNPDGTARTFFKVDAGKPDYWGQQPGVLQ